MGKTRDTSSLIGQKSNALTVIAWSHAENGISVWLCRCDCGQEVRLPKGKWQRNASCGCVNRAKSSQRFKELLTRHGDSLSCTYRTWDAMIQRCHNPNHHAYARYGGRGIKVCDEWRFSYETFLQDIGERPDGLTLERIDNAKGYYPANCRWATRREQGRNRDTNVKIEYEGKLRCITEWAEILKTTRGKIHRRLRKGLPIAAIVEELANGKKAKAKFCMR